MPLLIGPRLLPALVLFILLCSLWVRRKMVTGDRALVEQVEPAHASNGSRIALLMAFDEGDDLGIATAAHNRRYAERHGYHFFSFAINEKREEVPHFARYEAISALLERHGSHAYDYLIYLDADAVVSNPVMPVPVPPSGKEILFGNEHEAMKRRARFMRWLEGYPLNSGCECTHISRIAGQHLLTPFVCLRTQLCPYELGRSWLLLHELFRTTRSATNAGCGAAKTFRSTIRAAFTGCSSSTRIGRPRWGCSRQCRRTSRLLQRPQQERAGKVTQPTRLCTTTSEGGSETAMQRCAGTWGCRGPK